MKWRHLCLMVFTNALCAAACVMVEAPRVITPSGARITLLQHTRPVSGATVKLYGTNGPEWIYPARWSSSTDKTGTVTLPSLPAGIFELDFNFDHKNAVLRVRVSDSGQPADQDVLFDIAPDVMANVPKEISEDVATRAWLQHFAGTLEDQSEAVIPRAKVSLRRKADPHIEIATALTDDAGRFTLDLLPGEYVALFEMKGFKVEMVPFALGNTGWQAFTLKMRVSETDDCTPGTPSTQGELTELKHD